jgi:hypothetical protein
MTLQFPGVLSRFALGTPGYHLEPLSRRGFGDVFSEALGTSGYHLEPLARRGNRAVIWSMCFACRHAAVAA